MVKVKKIRRYSVNSAARTIAAGVYTTTSSYTFTTLFNLQLTRVIIHVNCYDSVSFQAQDLQYLITINGSNRRDNPGLIASSPVDFRFDGSTKGSNVNLPYYIDLAAGEILTVSYTGFLYAVTANNLNARFTTILEYLCPADYLSIDALAGLTP